MRNIALDIGKKHHYVVSMNEKGAIDCNQRLPNDPMVIEQFFKTLKGPCRVVLEATGNWMAVYDRIEPWVKEVVLAHPLKTKAIASARIKTDKIDATTLAHLLRADLIPPAYIPPKEVRDWRELVRHRAFLVRLRTRLKNRIHSLLAKRGITPPPVSDLFGKRGLVWLKALELPELYRAILNRYLAVLERLNHEIQEAEKEIDETVKATPEAKLLETVPGIGRYLSLLILAEIGEIGRFPSPKQLVSYAGLCPSTYQSGNTLRHGRLTKQGSAWLRWAFVEAAIHASQYPGSRLARLHERLTRRRDAKTARVTVARELCISIFHMLRKKESYREPSSSSLVSGR